MSATTSDETRPTNASQPLAGQSFAFFGKFAVWPSHYQAKPDEVVRRQGGRITKKVDEQLDYLVLGKVIGPGRAEALRAAQRLIATGRSRLKILDEVAFRELIRVDVAGRTFCFTGGFEIGNTGPGGLLTDLVECAGGTVKDDLDETLDYLVVGSRTGPGKIATRNRARKLQAAGARVQILDERAFLDLVRKESPKGATPGGFVDFVSQLSLIVDRGKLSRALDMLKTDAFKLYVHVDTKRLVGVVRSQRESDKVYASWLDEEGVYGCAQEDLEDCMGLQGAPCKHLLVLVIGLVRAGQLNPAQALEWMGNVGADGPEQNEQVAMETFVEYKGAEAGRIDWRPLQTVPEDYYAL